MPASSFWSINDCVAQALTDAKFGIVGATEFLLTNQVQAPMPARRKVRAEQHFAFERIGGMVMLGVFKVQRRVQRNLAPVGERVAHLSRIFILAYAAILVYGPSFIEINLETIGQADLELLLNGSPTCRRGSGDTAPVRAGDR
jgi:hypothetical protein